LHAVRGGTLERFTIGKRLLIENEAPIIERLVNGDGEFIGLEDPDIFIDENNTLHLYFTIPIKPLAKGTGNKTRIHLGHAVGKNLSSLVMTEPVLKDTGEYCAKELCVAPVNSAGFRYNLIESRDRQSETHYSTVQAAIAKDMGAPWEYGPVVFHPKTSGRAWIAGHASPGPLLPRSFIDIGEHKLLGLINGCEADKRSGDQIVYGSFSIGLFIYDYENGKIDWVSPEPLIQDTESRGRRITFASQFVETKPGEGILYAHVDDSFVRAYTLFEDGIRTLLP
jgi:hypothetical protein